MMPMYPIFNPSYIEENFLTKTLHMQWIINLFYFKSTVIRTDFVSKDLTGLHYAFV